MKKEDNKINMQQGSCSRCGNGAVGADSGACHCKCRTESDAVHQ